MSGQLNVEKPKVSGTGTVGLPPSLDNAMRWQAGQHPAVQAVDAKLLAHMAKQAAAMDAFTAERTTLDAERAAAVQAAMHELIG